MSKIKLPNINCKEIATENYRKQGENNLSEFPIVLKRAILDWEAQIRSKSNNNYLDAYEELYNLTGIAPQTLRKYVNIQNPEYPPLNKIFQICLAIGDKKPLLFINDLTKILFKN